MDGVILTLVTLAALCGSAALGVLMQPLLAEHHRSGPSTQVIWLVVGMIVTFSALVLGLLISSQKANFDQTHHDRAEFAAELTQLDQCLRNFGPTATPIRQKMILYTAASIAATWPDETVSQTPEMTALGKLPREGKSSTLGGVLNDAEMLIRNLVPASAVQARLASDCLDQFRGVIKQRWTMIAEIPGLETPFYAVLIFWMSVIFVCFGLFSPRNILVMTSVGLCAICLAIAMFTIQELDAPYSGLIRIPSTAMRNALADMLS